jgi:protocatechuate 3,4-dioxygenase beta subunit
MMKAGTGLSRREFLKLSVLGTASVGLAACAGQAATPAATSAPAATSVTAATAAPTNVPTTAPTTAPTATSAPAATSASTATAAPTSPPTTQPAAPTLQPTPATPVDADDTPTPAQTEGPYYTPNTPERNSLLEPGITGTRLVVSGKVLDTDGNPLPRALLDFWHANDAGQYDNVGYKLRGHQFTNGTGEYQLETIMPAVYTGRTRHIHVKVQPANQAVLTTQLYFPNEPANARDSIFNPELLMDVRDATDGKAATFNFVIQLR